MLTACDRFFSMHDSDVPPVTEMGWMHLDGRLVPRLLPLPPIPKACRDITSCGCTKGASAKAAAACKFVWNASRRATAGNLATTVVTLMTTRNKLLGVHLPVYMINSCTHVACQHHIMQCASGLYKMFP